MHTSVRLVGHRRRGFIKLHVGVDTKTKKIYAVVITDDKCGDSPQFEELVGAGFCKCGKIAKRGYVRRHRSRS